MVKRFFVNLNGAFFGANNHTTVIATDKFVVFSSGPTSIVATNLQINPQPFCVTFEIPTVDVNTLDSTSVLLFPDKIITASKTIVVDTYSGSLDMAWMNNTNLVCSSRPVSDLRDSLFFISKTMPKNERVFVCADNNLIPWVNILSFNKAFIGVSAVAKIRQWFVLDRSLSVTIDSEDILRLLEWVTALSSQTAKFFVYKQPHSVTWRLLLTNGNSVTMCTPFVVNRNIIISRVLRGCVSVASSIISFDAYALECIKPNKVKDEVVNIVCGGRVGCAFLQTESHCVALSTQDHQFESFVIPTRDIVLAKRLFANKKGVIQVKEVVSRSIKSIQYNKCALVFSG